MTSLEARTSAPFATVSALIWLESRVCTGSNPGERIGTIRCGAKNRRIQPTSQASAVRGYRLKR